MADKDDLRIWFIETDGDIESAEHARLSLKDELREIPGLSIKPVSGGAAPAGSKAIDLQSAALLIPLIVPAVELLGSVINVVRDWLSRQPRTTMIKIQIGGDAVEWSGGGAVPEPVNRLLEAATKRHAS
jgi:hypothetical protein